MPGTPTDTRPIGGNTYPDPPRNWKLSGGLLGGWVVILGLVLGAGFTVNAIEGGAQGDPTTETPTTPGQTVRQFFTNIFVDENHAHAMSLVCEGSSVDSKEILEDFKKSNDGFEISFLKVNVSSESSSTNTIAALDFRRSGAPDARAYRVSTFPIGDTFCIQEVSSA